MMTSGTKPRGSEGNAGRGHARRVTAADSGDGALIARLARGDHDALAALFGCYAPTVFGYAARLCGTERAEDVVQDVFIQLWQHPGRYDAARGTLRTFLLASTHSRCVDRLRSDTARRARESKNSSRGAPPADPEEAVMSRLVDEEVFTALRVLSDRERQVIVLAFFGGYTYHEVAKLLELPEGTVKSRIRSGLAHLRSELVST